MHQAIIFDFDGVIVLSEQARFNALQRLGKRYGLTVDDAMFSSMLGRTTNDFFATYFPHVDAGVLRDLLSDLQTEYRDNITDHVTPVQMTNDFIRSYSGDKLLAIASGSGITVLEKVLTHLGIRDKFRCVVSREQVTKHKPDPETYIRAAQALGLAPRECVAVEDTPVGAQAAIRAGMPVYILRNGLNAEEEFQSLAVAGFMARAEDLRLIA